jgi:hypothetical protein
LTVPSFSEGGRRYKAFAHVAASQFSDVLPFVDPAGSWPDRISTLTRLRTATDLLDSEQFQRYCYLKYSSLAGVKIEEIDLTLALRDATIYIESNVFCKERSRAVSQRFARSVLPIG